MAGRMEGNEHLVSPRQTTHPYLMYNEHQCIVINPSVVDSWPGLYSGVPVNPMTAGSESGNKDRIAPYPRFTLLRGRGLASGKISKYLKPPSQTKETKTSKSSISGNGGGPVSPDMVDGFKACVGLL
jgi:hypothetical protein